MVENNLVLTSDAGVWCSTQLLDALSRFYAFVKAAPDQYYQISCYARQLKSLEIQRQ